MSHFEPEPAFLHGRGCCTSPDDTQRLSSCDGTLLRLGVLRLRRLLSPERLGPVLLVPVVLHAGDPLDVVALIRNLPYRGVHRLRVEEVIGAQNGAQDLAQLHSAVVRYVRAEVVRDVGGADVVMKVVADDTVVVVVVDMVAVMSDVADTSFTCRAW